MGRVILETRRLVLRPVRLADLAAFYAHARLPEVWDSAGFPPPMSVDDTRAFVVREATAWEGDGQERFCFSILRLRGGRWIGAVNVRWVGLGTGVAEIGYSLHPDAWGQGYMTEAAGKVIEWAFAILGAHRAQATCWVKNRRSAGVLARLGMRREGTMRGYRLHQGVLRDHHLYGMTRSDWNAQRLQVLKKSLNPKRQALNPKQIRSTKQK